VDFPRRVTRLLSRAVGHLLGTRSAFDGFQEALILRRWGLGNAPLLKSTDTRHVFDLLLVVAILLLRSPSDDGRIVRVYTSSQGLCGKYDRSRETRAEEVRA
jgi:hypothetical protein